jgi:hypothetical protein
MKYRATWKEENIELEYTHTIWSHFEDYIEQLVLEGKEVTIRHEQ